MPQLTKHVKYSPKGRPPWSSAAHSYNCSLAVLDNNDAEAFRLNLIAAKSGMHDAVLAAGWFYRNGVGVATDIEEANIWYRKSARQGDPRAMFSLGEIAYDSKDFDDALVWCTRASEHGHSRSLYWIGKLHWRGQGVPMDRKLAMRLFSQAAAQKELEAQRAIRFLTSCMRNRSS